MDDGVSGVQLRSNLITEVLRLFQLKEAADKNGDSHISLSELTAYMKISQDDVKMICDVMRHKHLISSKVMPGEGYEYRLTRAGKVYLADIEKGKKATQVKVAM